LKEWGSLRLGRKAEGPYWAGQGFRAGTRKRQGHALQDRISQGGETWGIIKNNDVWLSRRVDAQGENERGPET